MFGYYIEVAKGQVDLVPDTYIRKQTLSTGERYITEELKELENTILTAKDRLAALEYDLFCELRELRCGAGAARPAHGAGRRGGRTCSARWRRSP